MAKRTDVFDATMREIRAQRDAAMEGRRSMPAERLERLHDCLGSEFPIESGLAAAAKERDEMLPDRLADLPRFVEAALAGRLLARAECGRRNRWRAQCRRVVQTTSRRADARTAVSLAAAAAVVAAAVVLVFQSGSRSSRIEVSSPPPVLVAPEATRDSAPHQPASARVGDNFLPPGNDQLTLRISTVELASLQPSLLTARYLSDQSDAGLPLDLPVRQSLMHEKSSRTP